ncbi:FAD-dependent oxidoreductase, partial [Nocardia asteroides]
MGAHRVVVLGAGYAGLAAATQLAGRVKGRGGVEVTMVDAAERFTERLRLHMSGTGQELAELSVPALLDGTGAHFRRGWVTALDTDAKAVRIEGDDPIPYDTLVYALGSVTDTASVPGAADHAHTLDGARGAAELAGRLGRLGAGATV